MNSQQGLLHTQGPCGALADGPEIFTIKDTSTSWSLPRLALPPRELGVSVAQNSYPWAKSQAPRYCSLTSWCSHNPLSLAPRLLGEAGEKRRYLPIISLRPCNPARGAEGREGRGTTCRNKRGGGGRRVINLLPNSMQEVHEEALCSGDCRFCCSSPAYRHLPYLCLGSHSHYSSSVMSSLHSIYSMPNNGSSVHPSAFGHAACPLTWRFLNRILKHWWGV